MIESDIRNTGRNDIVLGDFSKNPQIFSRLQYGLPGCRVVFAVTELTRRNPEFAPEKPGKVTAVIETAMAFSSKKAYASEV